MLKETAGEKTVSLRDIDRGSGSDDFECRLEAALADRPLTLVLDMAEVELLSSTIVAMLLWARRQCAAQGVDIVVGRPSRRCRDALERTGLLRVVSTGSGHGSQSRFGLAPASVH